MIGGILADESWIGDDDVEDLAPGCQGVLFIDVATEVEEAPDTIGLDFFLSTQNLLLVSVFSRLGELELP